MNDEYKRGDLVWIYDFWYERATVGFVWEKYKDIEKTPFDNYKLYITDLTLSLEEFNNPHLISCNGHALAPIECYKSEKEFVLSRKPFAENGTYRE